MFKNVPIFERLPGYNLQISSMQTPENRNIFGRRMEQRRGFPKGAHFRSAPLADFFGYFLVRRQESNITVPLKLQECILFYISKRPAEQNRRAFSVSYDLLSNNEPGRPSGLTTTYAPKSRTARRGIPT